MWHRYVGTTAGAQRSLWHGRRSHQVETDGTADVSTRPTVNRRSVSRARIPRKPVEGGGGGSSKASESVRLPRSEATTVQALMDLVLPRFAGLGDGPRQIHKPWMVSAHSPASPDASLVDTSGVEDRVVLSSPCLNLDELSSSDDDAVGPVVLSHL